MYYLNDVHHKYPEFSRWWKSKCESPSFNLSLNQIVYVQEENKYVQLLDIIPRERAYIYPGYQCAILGSGKQINMISPNISFIDQTIIYLQNNHTIEIFNNLEDARCHLI